MRPEPENPPGALAYFTQTAILRQIGFRRLGQLLNPFAADLEALHFALPEPDSDDYFPDLANALSVTERLPKSVLTILRTLENAASPANNEQLRSAIHRRIPHVSLSEDCALDRALELWFCAPDEFSPFLPASDIGGESAPASDQAQLNTSAPQSANEGALVLNGNGQTNHSAASDEEAFNRLARLSAVEYDRARPAEAARLGLRKETLDSEVARRRPLSDDAKARAVHLPAIEPWPLPVDGAELLDQVAARYALHLVLPPGAADVLALWTEHAHACAAFAHTPRLNLSSAHPGCGKTTTLDLLATMTPRPLRTENLTAPVLFRLIDQHQPTLLLDEVDSYLPQAEELRGLLNAGHKRGACAYRCEGESNAVRAFKAFAPAALAGIGNLPGTLHDRSIRLPLVEAEPGELAASFDSLHTEVETVLCRKLARWAQDNFAALQSCDPALPATAFNRLADNWRPLFAIAQVAGGDWPRLAAEAFASLSAKESRDGEGLGRLLLADIRQIFAQRGSDRLSSRQLVDCLCALADRPWREAQQGGKPINEIWLGRRLGRCGVRSHNIRLGDRQAKGYEFGDFAEAFDRLEEGEVD